MSQNNPSDVQMPPSKRPRLVQMAAPDGFAKPNTKPKSAQKASAPHFTSAFDKKAVKADAKSASKSPFRVPVQAFKQDWPNQQPPPKPRAALRALKPPSLTGSASGIARDSASNNKSSALLASLIPSLKDAHAANDPPLRPARPPVLPAVSASTSTAKPLKSVAPPLPPLLSAASISKPLSKSLNDNAPPLPPLPPAPVQVSNKEMRTITTTHIARATNLSTNSGVAELASIFLHDQHPNIVLVPTAGVNVAQDHNGLSLSQDKGSKGKGPKFVRNGFAARASSLFNRSRTSLLLWQKETEHHTGRRSTPDLYLRLVKILHLPEVLPTASPIQPIGIALCQQQSSKSNTASHKLVSPDEELVQVLFSFPPAATQSVMGDPTQFTEGRIIHVWAPWQEVSLSTRVVSPLNSSGHPDLPAAHIPASLPLPSSNDSAPGNSAEAHSVSDVALLCVRFLIHPVSSN